ncbi:cold shock domain-containing protein 3-like [Brassica napus]|uniref:cold shock domain-containing protein 3-like n=1 Tax=Brassica napus TaxID=3708 RepID=UPI002078AAE4|nr:cold shock domain-containing protein 3-like [Brassica napus]
MGTQVAAMAHLFMPLVNSSVGQATPRLGTVWKVDSKTLPRAAGPYESTKKSSTDSDGLLEGNSRTRQSSTVGELVERVALLESNLAEEAKLKTKFKSVPTGKTNDRKRKWDQVDGGKASSGRPECPKYGKNNPGECWKAMGACVRCGSLHHSIRDSTRPSRTQGQSSGSGSRTCFHCGQSGHFQSECPKRQGGQGKGCGDTGKSTQTRPTTTPRVYELSRDDGTSGSFDSVSGNF